MTVEHVRVGDVLRQDRSPIQLDQEAEYVSIGVRSFGKGIFHYQRRAGSDLGKLRFFEVKPDRLVISNIKGWEGALAASSDTDSGCVASNRFLQYTPIDPARIDIRWARWYLLSERGNSLIQHASPGSADRNRTLAVNRFETLTIPLPPIAEQRRVASHLSGISDALQLIRERTAATDGLLRAVVASISTGPKMSDNRKLEEGWREVAISDVLELQRRAVVIEPDRKYTLCGVYSFGKGIFHRDPKVGADLGNYRYFSIETGDLVVSNIQAWEGAIGLASQDDADLIGTHRFLSYTARSDRIETDWARWFLLSELGMELIRQATPGSTIRNRTLAIERFETLRFLLPPIGEQRRVMRHLQRVLGAVKPIRERQKRLDSLLSAAINKSLAEVS